MVDALDLKSKGPQGPCRFESCRPHAPALPCPLSARTGNGSGATREGGGGENRSALSRRAFVQGGAGTLGALGAFSAGGGLQAAGARTGGSRRVFRLACGWPGSGTWERGRALAEGLFRLRGQEGAGSGLASLSFRAISADGDLGNRALFERGEAESALIERPPPGLERAVASDEPPEQESESLGAAGFTFLHFVLRGGRSDAAVRSNSTAPLGGLRLATTGLDRDPMREALGGLGAELRGPFTLMRGLRLLASAEADGFVFWDMAPSPLLRSLAGTGARLLPLALAGEATRLLPGTSLQVSARPVEWRLAEGALGAPQAGAVRTAAKELLAEDEREA